MANTNQISFDEWSNSCLGSTATTILDIGCGYPTRGAKNIGHTVKYFVDAGYNAFGLDINENVTKLNEKFKYIEPKRFVCSDMFEYLKKNKNWDAILAANSFDDFTTKELIDLYKLAFKALSDGGKLIIEYLYDKMNPSDIIDSLNKAGFKVIIRYPAVTKDGKLIAHRFVATKK